MSGEIEKAVVCLVARILGANLAQTPEWLIRPGKAECGNSWPLIKDIYHDLTGMELPPVMRSKEWRKVDAVLVRVSKDPFILEFDEKQHFNQYRAMTLHHYMDSAPLAFDPNIWLKRSQAKLKLEGGDFASPKPPLFPGPGGRHRQRAFRDALCDILPPCHSFAPTLRIAHFEVGHWLRETDASVKMSKILEQRITF